MSKVVPAELQKVLENKCFKMKYIWMPLNLPHLE